MGCEGGPLRPYQSASGLEIKINPFLSGALLAARDNPTRAFNM